MEEFFNQIEPALMSLLATVITVVFSYLGVQIKQLVKRYVDTSEKKQVVNDVVRFVEQVYSDTDGPDKLDKALQTASDLLREKGLTIEKKELRALIESAVHGLKNART